MHLKIVTVTFELVVIFRFFCEIILHFLKVATSLDRDLNRVELSAYINTVLDRHHGITRSKQSGHVSSRASASVTNAQLSRLFSTCIREIVHLMTSLRSGSYMGATTLGTLLEVSYQVCFLRHRSAVSIKSQRQTFIILAIFRRSL